MSRQRTDKFVVVAGVDLTWKQQEAFTRQPGNRHIAAVDELVAERQHEKVRMLCDKTYLESSRITASQCTKATSIFSRRSSSSKSAGRAGTYATLISGKRTP